MINLQLAQVIKQQRMDAQLEDFCARGPLRGFHCTCDNSKWFFLRRVSFVTKLSSLMLLKLTVKWSSQNRKQRAKFTSGKMNPELALKVLSIILWFKNFKLHLLESTNMLLIIHRDVVRCVIKSCMVMAVERSHKFDSKDSHRWVMAREDLCAARDKKKFVLTPPRRLEQNT